MPPQTFSSLQIKPDADIPGQLFCSLPTAASLQVDERKTRRVFAPWDVPALQDCKMDRSPPTFIRLGSGRSFRGNGAAAPPWWSDMCVYVGRVLDCQRPCWWMKGSCSLRHFAVSFSPPLTARMRFTFKNVFLSSFSQLVLTARWLITKASTLTCQPTWQSVATFCNWHEKGINKNN